MKHLRQESMRGEAKLKTLLIVISFAAIAIAAFKILPVGPRSAGGRFEPFIKVWPLETPELIRFRGESLSAGEAEYQRGLDQYAAADYRRAEYYFEKAVSISPDQGDWWLILGVCQFLQRKPEVALESLARAEQLSVDPSVSKARWFQAQCFLMTERLDESVKLLEWLAASGKAYSNNAKELLKELSASGELEKAFGDGPQTVNPQGGETYIFGSAIEVSWVDYSPGFAGEYEVWLSFDGGLTYPKCVAQDLSSEIREWTWKPVSIAGRHLKVRVEATQEAKRRIGAASNEFDVSPPVSLQLIAPQGTPALYAGVPHKVRWVTPGVVPHHFRLELWRNESDTREILYTIESDIDGNLNEWTWENPGPVGGGYAFRLEAVYTDSSVEAYSDAAFEIGDYPSIVFETVSLDPRDQSLRIGWRLAMNEVVAQHLFLISRSTGEFIALQRDIAPAERAWEGSVAGIAEGEYELRLTIQHREVQLSETAGGSVHIENSQALAGRSQNDIRREPAASTQLRQNYPNPFNSSTTISYDLKESGVVVLGVYNIVGQKVMELAHGQMPAGHHNVQFDGTGLPSGVYLCRMSVGNETYQSKLTLTK